MRHLLLLSLALGFAACGDSNNKTVDAGTPADAPIDTPALLALDCTTYCTHLAADCTDANAQIIMANCMGTCAAFPPGAATDTSGNTLGCRNYHLQNIEVRGMSAATHCPHAGPVGGPVAGATAVCGASPCDDFCAEQTKVCGTDATPVKVENTEITHRYPTLAACTAACATFTKTREASPTATSGNDFACRIYHLTNAAAQTTFKGAQAHCGHTLDSTNFTVDVVGPCFQ
jgi:hypothetical protein